MFSVITYRSPVQHPPAQFTVLHKSVTVCFHFSTIVSRMKHPTLLFYTHVTLISPLFPPSSTTITRHFPPRPNRDTLTQISQWKNLMQWVITLFPSSPTFFLSFFFFVPEHRTEQGAEHRTEKDACFTGPARRDARVGGLALLRCDACLVHKCHALHVHPTGAELPHHVHQQAAPRLRQEGPCVGGTP